MSARRKVIPPAYRKSGRESVRKTACENDDSPDRFGEAIFDSHAWVILPERLFRRWGQVCALIDARG
jgi:hypothetical protein